MSDTLTAEALATRRSAITSIVIAPTTLTTTTKKFKGSEGERLGQLVVTPEVVVSKINNMKENKSPGVGGISMARRFHIYSLN